MYVDIQTVFCYKCTDDTLCLWTIGIFSMNDSHRKWSLMTMYGLLAYKPDMVISILLQQAVHDWAGLHTRLVLLNE